MVIVFIYCQSNPEANLEINISGYSRHPDIRLLYYHPSEYQDLHVADVCIITMAEQ
jgi:hypothetical protein